MCRRVDAASATAHDGDAQVSQLIGQLAGDLQTIMGREAGADHRDRVFVLGSQPAFHIEHNRRVINLPQQLGIIFVRLGKDMATEVADALQFAAQVNGFLPAGNGLGGFVADALDMPQLLSGSIENGGGIAKDFQQLTHANWTDVLDHIESDECFPGLHVEDE